MENPAAHDAKGSNMCTIANNDNPNSTVAVPLDNLNSTVAVPLDNAELEQSRVNDYADWNTENSAEDEDVSMGVAVSLDYAQPESSQVKDHANWIPNSAIDWPTYNRQVTAYNEAVTVHRDFDLQTAIQKSRQDAELLQAQSQKDDEESEPNRDVNTMSWSPRRLSKGKQPEPRPNIDARIQHLSIMLDSEVPCVYDFDGDTWIYIDPPARQPEQDYLSYQRYVARYANPIVMQSSKLLALDSSYFNKCFGSTYQHRIIRRRGLVNKLPNNIKFVIDLTPPAEGDDAVYLTTELCCSKVVRQWHQAGQRWNVSKTLIGGQDDHMLGEGTELNKNRQQMARNPALTTDRVNLRSRGTESTRDEKSPAEGSEAHKNQSGNQSGLIPEYSPVRHRCAIERILIAIQGLDPQLDSAPKVWTTFAVAKYFDITNGPLIDYIVRWLRSYPNTFFIEALPETTLKIADGLRCEEVFRDAFAILVGEEALENVHRAQGGQKSMSTVTVYGRKKAELPEEIVTSIEYASKAFADRMILHFTDLVDQEMEWVDTLAEFQKLKSNDFSSVAQQQTIRDLKRLLKEYVKGPIYTLLSKDYFHMPGPTRCNSGGDDLFPRKLWEKVWMGLNPRERILTRTFWSSLSGCILFNGDTNLYIESSDNFSPLLKFSPAEINLHRTKTVHQIHKTDLISLVTELNRLALGSADDNSGATDASDVSPCYPEDPLACTKVLPIISGKPEAPNVNVPQEDGQRENTQSISGENIPKTSFTFGVSFKDESLADSISNMTALKNASSPNLLPSNAESSFEHHQYPDSLLPAQYEAEGSSVSFEQHKYVAVPELFDLDVFFGQASSYLYQFADRMLSSPDASTRDHCLELGITNTLVSLTEYEWKFLPLWAGGNDDGTGGVFNDDVPMSSDGFSTAGPKVHTGSGNSTASSESSYTMIQSVSNSSDQDTSVVVNDGYSDTLPRGIAVSEDSDMSWVGDLYQSKGKGVEGREEAETATLTSTPSVTFDSDEDFDFHSNSAKEDDSEEQCAQKLVDDLEAMEKEEANNGETEMDVAADLPDEFLDDVFANSDSDSDATLSGDHVEEEGEDEDMLLI